MGRDAGHVHTVNIYFPIKPSPTSLAPARPHGDVGNMDRKLSSTSRLLATWPLPVRMVAGLGLLGLSAWLPAMIALFR